jgi:hypothetical protein
MQSAQNEPLKSASANDVLSLPPDFPLKSTALYRLWIYTAFEDPSGKKGDVSLCLHGALGSVWLQQLQKMTPTTQGATTVYGCANDKDGKPKGRGGERCELYVHAQDVGTLHRLTVAYAHGGATDKKCQPWRLSQVVVRHGGDGVVTAFPAASTELKPPEALLELMPRLSWHEDLFGNMAEAPPPPPPAGQWHWPAAARFDASLHAYAAHDEIARASEQEAFQLKLYKAVLTSEILPLVEETAHDVAMMRTPGTFLHGVAQCAAGQVIGSAAAMGTMEELRRYAHARAPPTPPRTVPPIGRGARARAAVASERGRRGVPWCGGDAGTRRRCSSRSTT